MSLRCAVFESFTNVHTLPSRSQTQSRFVPGTGSNPTALVKMRFGNALTADQLPETTGETGGKIPFKKGPTAGRELIP